MNGKHTSHEHSTALPLARREPNPFSAAGASAFAYGRDNPFSPARSPFEVPADAPEGSYTYALVQSAPEVPPEEVELAEASLEVMVRWGASVLHVAHMSPPRSFWVGEESTSEAPCDFVMPRERLGAARAPVVLRAAGGELFVVLPAGARAKLTPSGGSAVTGEEAIASGLARPCRELEGAHEVALAAGSSAEIEIGEVVFSVAATRAGRRIAGGLAIDSKSVSSHGLSLALHAGLLAAAAFLVPPLASASTEGVDADQSIVLRHAIAATAEPEVAAKEPELLQDGAPADREGGQGARAGGEEGKMGSDTSRATNLRYGIAGHADNPDPRIAREAALRDAADFGMIGLLHAGAGGDPKAPTAPWGGAVSSGLDALSARGNMWGADIGEAGGANGLGLSGIGEGGGRFGEGIGLGGLGPFGHGGGLGTGQGFGPGRGMSQGLTAGAHKPQGIRMRESNTVVSGRIPPEVVQRIVRQNFGRFRLCYENGLRNNPNLAGRVAVRFVIGRDGAVSNAGSGGSDLPDGGVVSCVVRSFYGLSFPQPEGGIVTVTYPIVFSPGS